MAYLMMVEPKLYKIPLKNKYFSVLQKTKNANSRLFVPALKNYQFSPLWKNFFVFSRFSVALQSINSRRFLPASKFIKKYHFQPLFCRFVKTKKLALFAASLPLRPKRNWPFSTAFLPLWKEKNYQFLPVFSLFDKKIFSIVLGKLHTP